MPEEKIKEIVDRNKRVEQRIIGIVIALITSVGGWYLKNINDSIMITNRELATTNKEIVSTNLKTNELMIRMLNLEETVNGVRIDSKELSKRTGSLERIVEGHERELKKK